MDKPVGWEKITLGEAAAPIPNSFVDGPFGSNLKSEEYSDEGIRLIQLQNIGEGYWIDDHKKFIPPAKFEQLKRHAAYPGDIAIAKMADPVGRACLIPPVSNTFVVVADCIRLAPNLNRHDPTYLVYAINHRDIRLQAEQKSTGTTRLRINLSKLKTLEFYAPPLTEQRRIAEILDTADEAIRQTEHLIAKLKQMKQGLLHDLLTRGLDAHGHLRDPLAHPEQFKDSPLGRIPREWEIRKLDEIAVKIQDGTHFSPQSTSGPFRYVTSKNIRFGYLDLTDCGWISEEEHKAIYARCDVQHGDVLFTKDGASTGNATLNTLTEPFSLLSSVALLRFDSISNHAEYILQYFLSPIGQRRIKDLMSGNAITRLTLQKIKAFSVPIPSGDEQKRIAIVLNTYDSRIRTEEAYRDKLKLQKQGLMHDLLTGRVRV